MRILLSSAGSMGDLLPYARIGQVLRERGHTVIFAVEQRFADWLSREGFPVCILQGDIITTYREMLPRLPATTDAAATLRILLDEYLLPTMPQRIDELIAACQGVDALISSNVQLASAIAADLTGIPFVSIALTPAILPDPALAPLPYAWPHGPTARRAVNRFAWRVGRMALRRVSNAKINQVRALRGLPPRHDFFLEGGISHVLTAVAVSPAILPSTLQWPTYAHATGFCFWDQEAWDEPADLMAFLAASFPVIAVTLGSVSPVTGKLLATLYHTSVAAIRAVGARALVIGAPAEALPPPSPDMLALPYVPHARVFPRCAAVIHHGGIGTASQAWRAGIPSLVVPGGVDQYLTASLVLESGTGHWQRRETCHVPRLCRHLQDLLGNTTMHQRVKALSAKIGSEDGASHFADALEQCLR